MRWLKRLLFPEEAEVLTKEDFFGQGYDLGFNITNQRVEGRIRVIEGIAYMEYGGSLADLVFYVPANRRTFIIDKDSSSGPLTNDEGYFLKTPRRSPLSSAKVTAWRANEEYPQNRFRTY